jgi:hypothetical protein
MDVAFGQRLVDASLVCPQRTAALQKQGNAFEGDTIIMSYGTLSKLKVHLRALLLTMPAAIGCPR